MIIRAEEPRDYDAIHAVLLAAFADEKEVADLPAAARETDGYVPELALVAEEDGEVVGHVLLSYCGLETEAGPRRVLQLSPIGVVPARQRQGIGSALVRAALERADALGEPLVVLIGHPEYYPRFGFRPASRIGIEHPTPIRDEVFMAVQLSAYDPSLRGRLVYPPAWAEFV